MTTPTPTPERPPLRPGRQITPRGGYGMAIQLPTMQNTPAVFWSSAHHNSYVTDGYTIYSINGIGEIRWAFPATVTEACQRWTGDSGAGEAFAYFYQVTP